MRCPACRRELVSQDFGVQVQVCQRGCHGIWFDRGQLAELDENNKGAGDALAAALHSPGKNDDARPPLVCSRCSTLMHCHRYRRAKEVNVDECYVCGAFFLDSGELREIRDHHMTDAEIATYADTLLRDVPGYLDAQVDRDGRKIRARAIGQLSRLLSVRYWSI